MMNWIVRIFISVLFSLIIMQFTNSTAKSQAPYFNVSITKDLVSNFGGGIKTGQAFLGLIDLQFNLNPSNMEHWKHSHLRLQLQNTYGQTPTQELVGDVQVFSNIENGTCTYLHQLWYQYKNNDIAFIIGKHDVNEQYFTSEYGGAYVNSSFGIMPLVSLNVPVSIFPSTTMGLSGSYRFTDGFKWQAAVYNGYPCDLTDTNFGLDFDDMRWDEGLFYVSEVHLADLIPGSKGTYKLGSFYHGGEMPVQGNPGQTQRGAGGAYLIADQQLYTSQQKASKELGMLFQMGYSPSRTSLNDFYLAYGFNY